MLTFSRWRFALLALLVATTGSANDLSHLVRARQQESGAPGMTAAVITSDSIEVFASGLRRADRPQRVTKDDAFGIGADAKAMLATVIATEVEAGRLRWDTTLGEVMPEIAATGRAVYRTVTLAQLLNHQAGLPQLLTQEDLVVVPRLRGPVVLQRVQFVRWAVRQQPLAPPGTAVLYSNAGHVVAAAMLERVTAQRYELLMQRRLFAPLGITARFEWPAAGGRRRQPWGHLFVAGEAAPVDPDDPSTQFPEWLNPAGNVSMNARDFGRFVRLHLRACAGLLISWRRQRSCTCIRPPSVTPMVGSSQRQRRACTSASMTVPPVCSTHS
jgi:CubicO group peptidase (beta-lactamase class C family)